MSKKVTKTLEYDAEGRVVKETTVEESTDVAHCALPHFPNSPCTRPHSDYYTWGLPWTTHPKAVYTLGSSTLKGDNIS